MLILANIGGFEKNKSLIQVGTKSFVRILHGALVDLAIETYNTRHFSV